ncbi:prepilin-type N-terminal cleavage/methylation domain-containing protein [Orbaceae bacterium ESL0721]|nr:prepilin-type N-terminal cleavage/methylation domain-containing protein [Orbaceae bacterium ESL0721]
MSVKKENIVIKKLVDKPPQTFTNDCNGFSLIEVLIAALLFAILLLGLTSYQQKLMARHHAFYNRLQAERIAFQLLESYPNSPTNIIPPNWHHQITNSFYTAECRIISITITLPTQQKIVQKRVFC